MNGLQITLCVLFGIFFLLWLASPRRPRFALRYLRYLVLGLATALVLSPFVWLVAAAFKDKDVLNLYMFFPPISEWSAKTMNLGNFRELFKGEETLQGTVYFWRYLINSLFLASAGTSIQLLLSSMGGFALAKYRFRGKRLLTFYMLGSMMIPPVILLAPLYEIIVAIGWVDTYYALIVPIAVSVFGMFLFRQAMLAVPDDLIEAARIDGCGEFRIYLNMVMPLVRPMSAAFCLVTFLWQWNAFLQPNVYLSSQAKLPMPVVLTQYITTYEQQYGVFLAGTLLAIIPPAILFFALQREFVSGLTSGAVKG